MEIKDFETKMVGRRLIWTDTGREPGKQHGVFHIDRAEYSKETDKIQLFNQQQRVFALTPAAVLALITTGRFIGEYKRGWDGDTFRKEYTLVEVSEQVAPHNVPVSLKPTTGEMDANEMARRLVGRRLRWFDDGRPPKLQRGVWHVDAVEIHPTGLVVLDLSNDKRNKRAMWDVARAERLAATGAVVFPYNDTNKINYTLEG